MNTLLPAMVLDQSEKARAPNDPDDPDGAIVYWREGGLEMASTSGKTFAGLGK